MNERNSIPTCETEFSRDDELEKAKCEIKLQNKKIEELKKELAYEKEARSAFVRERNEALVERNAIKWTLETIFGRVDNG